MIQDLDLPVKKTVERLSSPEYGMEKIWQKESYGWPADWEGRALSCGG